MGGGMFNVPREVLPQDNQGVKLFDIQPESVANPSADKPAPAPAKVHAIKLNLAPGADVNQAWEDFFARHEAEKDPAKLKLMSPDALKAEKAKLVAQQQAVLETVQELKDAAAVAAKHDKKDEATKKHEEIIAVIEAALRHDQAQPWMYEVLAMSMKAADRPQEEIDRAIMSAAEFTQNAADLMYLGAFLTQSNMDRRALQIYRQAAQIEPLWPEPYYYGMMAARNLEDLPGLEWLTAGILGQAWPPSQARLWDDAMRVAQARLDELEKNNRKDDADHLIAVINQALVRDCVVRVRWTGDADIDVMVKEPAGTVCSLRNLRTTSGGILVNDPPSDDKVGIDGHVAVYACPKAFSGNYQLLIRRVFGKLTTGQVSVEVITHYNTPQAHVEEKKIPLGSGEALVKFDVADGRRKESIQEQKAINAAVDSVAEAKMIRNTQAILAQQLNAANDPQASAALAAAQQQSASSSAAASQMEQVTPYGFPTAWANGLHGAVGYQPIITTLPSGTNLMATGVVSADRRYVRITTVPLFSAISAVSSFNVASGGAAQGLAGTVGGGANGGNNNNGLNGNNNNNNGGFNNGGNNNGGGFGGGGFGGGGGGFGGGGNGGGGLF